ncbi:substrate-binding periplasmic protein [Thalassotalea piscium]
MQYYSITFLFLLLSSFFCFADTELAVDDIQIKVVTEDSFPIQFLDQGEIVGSSTTFVKQVLDAAKVSYDIEMLPWARAYYMALNEPNVLIYSLAKTKKRSDSFKWVGELMTLDYYLYGMVDSQVNEKSSLDDLKQFRIGAVRDSAVYQYLHSQGFKNLTVVVHGLQGVQLVQANRIDLFPSNKSTFQAICHKEGLDCEHFKPVYKLNMPVTKLFMAFSQSTDDAIVEKVRAGYNQVNAKRNNLTNIVID